MFINLPYAAVVYKEAKQYTEVIQVTATDQDKAANADIYYQLVRGNGDLFRVERKSGVISLRRSLQDERRKEFTLTIAAYDGGSPPYSAEIPVHIKVVDKSVPTFLQQSFQATVAENTETFSAVITTQAETPASGGRIIYTIETGNENQWFSMDHNEGVVYVTSALDYEEKQFHQLTLRATDSKGGGYSEAILLINVEDVNDNAPVFGEESYSAQAPESLPVGSVIIKVEASDLDTGLNQVVEYSLSNNNTVNTSNSDMFSINAETGEIILTRHLDHERDTVHHLTVLAQDHGPRLPGPHLDHGLTHVWVHVVDINDNAPVFEDTDYQFTLSDTAVRGQFVGKVRALDLDSDQHQLLYSIIGGNEHQIFSIDQVSGVISLVNLHQFDSVSSYSLNVSVSDGVYSANTRVRVQLEHGNNHSPRFSR